jgi:ABC-2 type transport system ATP-binding protein
MIEAYHVKKYFGPLKALDIASFEARRGEIIGFLGLNGAGKTTFMRILTTYLPATAGEVRVCGYDVATESMAVRRKVGYLSETPPLYPDMTVRDFLRYAARLKDLEPRAVRRGVDKALAQCNLGAVAGKVIGHLSKGYKQRVGIAQAVLNDPELLILDEPTNGLDPVQIRDVRQLIKDLEHKRTVIVSTHVLSEIEALAQRILILKNGRILKDHHLNAAQEAQDGPLDLEEMFIRLTTQGPKTE